MRIQQLQARLGDQLSDARQRQAQPMADREQFVTLGWRGGKAQLIQISTTQHGTPAHILRQPGNRGVNRDQAFINACTETTFIEDVPQILQQSI